MWWSLEFNSLGIFCFEWYYGSDDSMFVHFILQCKLSNFVHKPWGASSYYLEQSSWSYHNIYLSFGILFVVHLVACFICWSFLTSLSFLQSLILSIVWFLPTIRHWICAFDSTQIMRNAHDMDELSLYWPSKFFTHFGNWCQWGRSLEGLREFGYVFALCLSMCLYCIASCCFA